MFLTPTLPIQVAQEEFEAGSGPRAGRTERLVPPGKSPGSTRESTTGPREQPRALRILDILTPGASGTLKRSGPKRSSALPPSSTPKIQHTKMNIKQTK